MKIIGLIIGCIATLGCSPGPSNIIRVSTKEYSSDDKCWKDSGGRLSAFAIFDEGGGGYVPSFISFKCIPSSADLDNAQAYIANLNAFRVKTADTNLMQFGFNNATVFHNDSVEFRVPNEQSKVYFVKADIREDIGGAVIKKFEEVSYTGLTFGQFLQLPESKTYELGVRLNGGAR